MTKPTISVEEAKRRRRAREEQQRERTEPPRANGHAKDPPRFKLLGLDDLDITTDDDWLIDGVLPSKGVGTLYGRYKTYKSFVSLDMAWAIADHQRRDWGGRQIRRHGIVVYIVCEGRLGVRKRLLAMIARQGADELPILWRIEGRPNLGTVRAVDAAEIVASIRLAFPHDQIALVVIDTLARTLFREESNETLSAFLDNCEDISEQLACLVLAVHHEGVDAARPRGGTMLPAGTVVQLHLKRNRGQKACQLFVEEAKDTESDFGFDITLASHELGTEHDVQRESTLIVESVTPLAVVQAEPDDEQNQERRRGGGRPNRSQPLLSTTYNQQMDRFGIELQLPDGMPRVKAVNRDYVRNGYVQRRSDLTKDDAEREFRRALAKAIEGEQIVTRELQGTVWLWSPQKGALL